MTRLSLFLSLFLLGSLQAVIADDKFPSTIDRCVACHGALGESNYGLFPNLNGQKKAYLVKQLKDFRKGVRYDPWMTPMALPLKDDEIEELASFYSQL